MTKIIKGYYKDGVYHQYGKLYSGTGTETDGAMTQKAVTDELRGIDLVQYLSFVKQIFSGATQPYISGAGVYTNNANYRGYYFSNAESVDKRGKYIKLIPQTGKTVRVGFTKNAPMVGETAQFAEGYTTTVLSSETLLLKVPNDTEYIYIMVLSGSGNDISPARVEFYDKGSIPGIIESLNDSIQNRTTWYVAETIYGNTISKGKGWIVSSSFKFRKASSTLPYYGAFIPISDYRGKEVKIYPNPAGGYYAFTTSAPTADTTTSIVCYGRALETLTGGSGCVMDVVPDDAQYLYIYMESDGNAYAPDRVELIDYADTSSVDALKHEITGEETIKSLTPSSLNGVGYLRADGQFWLSSDYVGGFIDIRDYVGCKIKVTPCQRPDDYKYYARYAFTKISPSYRVEESILCDNCEMTTYYGYSDSAIYDTIPTDAKYLYFMIYATGVNLCPAAASIVGNISDKRRIDSIKEKHSTAQLFNYYLPNVNEDDPLNGLDAATITEDGLTMAVGNAITLQEKTVFDTEDFALDVTASTTDKVLMYTASDETGALSENTTASYVLFDFVNGRISVYQAGTINPETGTGTELKGVDFVSASGKYILSIGRKKRNMFASLYNKDTRVRTIVEIVETDYPQINNEQRPAGWLYSYPSFMVLAGAPVFKRFTGTTINHLFMLFQGDSYTQGYAGTYADSWAARAAEYFGNSMTCGISGAKLADLVTQYHDSIKSKIQTDYMVISVGVNDRNDLDTDAKIAAWGVAFLTYCQELLGDGIIPIVNKTWVEGSASSATATLGAKMNKVLRIMGFDGAEFGAVSGFPNGAAYYSSHLNYIGNNLSYDIFVNELSHLKK